MCTPATHASRPGTTETHPPQLSQEASGCRESMADASRRDQSRAKAEYAGYPRKQRICRSNRWVSVRSALYLHIANVGARDREQLNKLMTEKRIGAYVGVDPTAPSLHVGHLVPLMALFWMYIHGFHTVSLVSLPSSTHIHPFLTISS